MPPIKMLIAAKERIARIMLLNSTVNKAKKIVRAKRTYKAMIVELL
jgi:hypothetical protein